ncbi:hypothetical protein WJN01_08345 [Flavobacteriaceae bacterium SZ-1-7]|uniref:hypothetical protein n=1 Tax=Tamlana sedimenti TaxID=3134126 RepID=UPI0031206CF2
MFIVIFFPMNNQILAQGYEIYELTNKPSKDNSSSDKNNNSRLEFYDLSQRLYNTSYFKNGELKSKYGDGTPIKITLDDLNSLETLNISDVNYKEVKLITLSLENESDLNSDVDLSGLSELSKLKYVFIKCYFNADKQQVEQAIISPKNKIRVFYTFVNPS